MTGLMTTLRQAFGLSNTEDDRPRLKDGPAFKEKYSAPREVLKEADAIVATPAEYVDWLEGHLKAGGSIDGVDIGNTQIGHNIHIARRDFALPPILSTSALKLIVPENINVTLTDPVSEHGQNHLYRMDGYKKEGMSKSFVAITVYADTLAEMKKREFFNPITDKLDQAMALVPRIGINPQATPAEARVEYAELTKTLPERNQLIGDINAILKAQLQGPAAVTPVVPHTALRPA